MGFKTYGIIAIVIFCSGVGAGFKLFNKPKPAELSIEDHSQEKKSGTKTVYLPSKCDGKPQEIASIESFDSEVKKDVRQLPVLEKKNAISYMPKYNFEKSKILQAASYDYDYYGIYAAENPEIGVKFTYRW